MTGLAVNKLLPPRFAESNLKGVVPLPNFGGVCASDLSMPLPLRMPVARAIGDTFCDGSCAPGGASTLDCDELSWTGGLKSGGSSPAKLLLLNV